MYQSFGHSYLWARADGARLLTYSSPDLSGFYPDKADTSKKGIVTFTGCRGTKPPHRVFRCGFNADILGLSQLVMC